MKHEVFAPSCGREGLPRGRYFFDLSAGDGCVRDKVRTEFPDITERKQAQEQLLQVQRHLLLDAIGQLAVGATHDSKWIADDHRR
jgi:hypothetical protein